MKEVERKEFEEWVRSMDCKLASFDHLTLARTKYRYESLAVALAWEAWQEAKEQSK